MPLKEYLRVYNIVAFLSLPGVRQIKNPDDSVGAEYS
jgi:hypothetical protein